MGMLPLSIFLSRGSYLTRKHGHGFQMIGCRMAMLRAAVRALARAGSSGAIATISFRTLVPVRQFPFPSKLDSCSLESSSARNQKLRAVFLFSIILGWLLNWFALGGLQFANKI